MDLLWATRTLRQTAGGITWPSLWLEEDGYNWCFAHAFASSNTLVHIDLAGLFIALRRRR